MHSTPRCSHGVPRLGCCAGHSCPGASLARVEGRVTLERVLARMADIRISEEHHGPAGDRRYSYEPAFFARGLKELHIEFTPV